MAKARRLGMAARSSSTVMEGVVILVVPIGLTMEPAEARSIDHVMQQGAASRHLAHDVLDLRRCWLVQHVLIAGLQLRSDASDPNGVCRWRGDGANVRLA